MKSKKIILMTVVAALCAMNASAAEDTVKVGINVNYGFAYRDGAWAPVDVIVQNNVSDLNGWVEVKLFSATNELQSPIYRVAAGCPKGSRKRFRLTCFFSQTARVEAQFYSDDRPVIESPVIVQTTSIKPKDFLTLVLDREIGDYGFLNSVLQDRDSDMRIYRENLKTENLSSLSDHSQCYKSFNAIILGNIDPTRISEKHRRLLRAYAADGGVLILLAGENASKYKGTWVEELFGVEIGAAQTIDEAEAAKSIFSAEKQAGAVSGRNIIFANIIPKSKSVEAQGLAQNIATVNRIGNGAAIALAVDASSRAFQNCAGYLNLWSWIFSLGASRKELNFKAGIELAQRNLPNIVGIEIQPRSSVMLYLGLYFGIGVVLNWLICNRRKRRELFWLFLIGFSAAFTGYAMVFGTTGRAKSSEVENIEVAYLPKSEKIAHVNSIVGVLTARTSRLSFQLPGEQSLARDVSPATDLGYRYNRRNNDDNTNRPFYFSEDDPPQIDDLLTRASSMRMLHIEKDIALDGGIEGVLIRDSNGINGLIKNNTGLKCSEAYLLYRGTLIKLRTNPGGWLVSISSKQFGNPVSLSKNYNYAGSINDFKMPFLFRLFSGEVSFGADRGYGYNEPQMYLSANYRPLLLTWTQSSRDDVLGSKKPLRKNIQETLLVAEVDVEEKNEGLQIQRALFMRLENPDGNYMTRWYLSKAESQGTWRSDAEELKRNGSTKVEISIPELDTNAANTYLNLDVYFENKEGIDFIFYPDGYDAAWSEEHKEESKTLPFEDMTLRRQRYHFALKDIGNAFDAETHILKGIVKAVDSAGNPEISNKNWIGKFKVSAYIITGGKPPEPEK